MRLAGSVGARMLIVAAACAVIAGVAWRVSMRRPPPVPAAMKMSRAALDYVPAPATAGSRVVSSDLPPWFGLPDAPPVTIFGMVVGKRLPRSVHLSLAVPDPGIWPGRDAPVSPTGGFDFGPMRRGAYRVSAAIGDQCDIAFLGTVVDADGAPVPRVGVQPIYGHFGHLCDEAPVVVTSDAAGRFSLGTDAQLCGIRIYRNRDAYEAPYLRSSEQYRPMMLREGLLGDESRSRSNARSPVPRTYVVDPIEVRARGDGPLELVVRIARPQPRHGHAFAELTAPPARH